jgi:hypothetical protein
MIKTKKIPEINKEYYQIVKLKCDCCNKEIEEGELYLEVNYHKERYEDELSYKEFCKNCIKENLYDMFMNNYYTNFDKYNYYTDENWYEYDEFDDDLKNREIIEE